MSVSHNPEADGANNHSLVHRDDVGARLGMWLFLFTEVLLFGGLFLLYMAYRYQYSIEFKLSAKELSVTLGAVNTIILLTSSLTMALSIDAIQRAKKKLSLFWLGSTIFLALFFLVNKYFEWSAKFEHGLMPGSETLLNKTKGEIIFFGLYYTMTGLHALHVIIGIFILAFMFIFLIKDIITPESHVKLENSGLYWHLVDLIWIFLFPLFYLLH